MEKDIINFSEFYKERKDFNDFSFNENDEQKQQIIDIMNLDEDLGLYDSIENIETSDKDINENFDIENEDEIKQELETEQEEENNEVEEIEDFKSENLNESNYYMLYKDKNETFSCEVSVEGANLNDTYARLVIESKDWNLVFKGEIDSNGKCTIPIKKLAILNEGEVGDIRLEVVAEGSMFIPWESEFKIKVNKKVSVKFNESKYNRKDKSTKKNVKVRF